MFEDVSFPSPSSPSSRPTHLTVDGDDRLMGDCNSMLISPLSSRSRFTNCRSQQQPLASIPFPYEPKRLSISTLTQRLHEHTLQAPSGGETSDQGRPRHDRAWLSSQYFDDVLTPPDFASTAILTASEPSNATPEPVRTTRLVGKSEA
ncbi:hypothetical protein PENSUB_7247 [Penicillium subrubescens]|uniref:Uncharacterized protein n=1 Tax=Penicillium subrubescens TaxID=1316194 RepID=A0A1Q5TNB1_9EURO|nr:hypothetical protein PENSUB_7247 [Penicillium subrubescens]